MMWTYNIKLVISRTLFDAAQDETGITRPRDPISNQWLICFSLSSHGTIQNDKDAINMITVHIYRLWCSIHYLWFTENGTDSMYFYAQRLLIMAWLSGTENLQMTWYLWQKELTFCNFCTHPYSGYSLSRCRIQFGRWRSWFSTLPGFLFFRWSRLHWFSTAGWGFSWSSAVVFLCFSRPQFSQWLRCSQVHAFSWYVPGNSFAPLWFCSSISSLFFLSSITDRLLTYCKSNSQGSVLETHIGENLSLYS